MLKEVNAMKRFKDILCVVEPERVCIPILERAVTLAENNQASVTMVHVVPYIATGTEMLFCGPSLAELQVEMINSHKQQLESVVEPYKKRIKIETKVLVGTTFLEIIREVLRNRRELVIKIPEQLDWLDRLFGSDDMHLLRKCPCPVWLIKPQAPKANRCILAAVDVDDAYPSQEMKSRRALNRQIIEMASSLALTESADLHIAHAWDAIGEGTLRHGPFINTPENEINAFVEQVRRQQASNLDELMQEVAADVGLDALKYLNPQKHLVKGLARKEIPALVKRINADLVVMGTVARTGVPGFIMGNTAETILNQIDCSVFAVKPPGFETPVTLND